VLPELMQTGPQKKKKKKKKKKKMSRGDYMLKRGTQTHKSLIHIFRKGTSAKSDLRMKKTHVN
jgi:hypothetical protein